MSGTAKFGVSNFANEFCIASETTYKTWRTVCGHVATRCPSVDSHAEIVGLEGADVVRSRSYGALDTLIMSI